MGYTWPSHTGSDLEAIKWALVPGVSGTTMREGGTEDNAGAGLFIVKSISMLTRDYFVMYSGSGIYRLLKRRPDVRAIRLNANPDKDRNSQTNEAPYFPGTLVAIDISMDGVKEFSVILDSIRRAYSQAVRERKKERYKRPKFI
jgi:hypothetical protein